MNIDGVPGMYGESMWNWLDFSDYQSVLFKEKLTSQALFVLLHSIVKDYNQSSEKTVAISHVQFYLEYLDNPNAQLRSYMFFTQTPKEYLIVPILESDHFYCIVVSYLEKAIFVVDSLNTFYLKTDEIKRLLRSLNDNSSHFKIVFKSPDEVFQQKDTFNCGILTARNVETYLNNGRFYKTMNIKLLRNEYAEKLKQYMIQQFGSNPNEFPVDLTSSPKTANKKNVKAVKSVQTPKNFKVAKIRRTPKKSNNLAKK